MLKLLEREAVYELLSLFRFLETNSKELIEKYGLLPNDALIGATALFYKLDGIITLDEDFTELGRKENLHIVSWFSAEVIRECGQVIVADYIQYNPL